MVNLRRRKVGDSIRSTNNPLPGVDLDGIDEVSFSHSVKKTAVKGARNLSQTSLSLEVDV